MKIQGLTEPSFDEKSCPLTIYDANNIYHFSTNDIPYRSEVSSSSAFVYGIESFKQSIKEIPSGVQANVGGLLQKAGKTMQEYFPDGVDIFNGAVNVKIGDKLVEGGKLLSRTANRNLDVMREKYKKESPRLESAQQKVAFDFGSQGANWTSMLLAGPYSPFLMAGLTMTGETQERLEKWKETHGTVEGYEERQGDDSVWNVANSFVQGTIEKYLGSWAQVKAVKKGWGYVKAIGKNAIQEGFVEEPLQDVTDFYFDKLSGLSEDETLRDRMFGSLRGYVVASIFGGAGGYSAALYHRSTGIETYKDVMKGTVPEQDLEKAATKAYEQDAKTMRDIITVELESSSSLQTKRGEVYESLYNAALEQVKVAKEQGGFPELQTEEDIANYVKSVADDFADETLAEAHRRNTIIEEVLDPSLIRYENGQLVMPMTKGTTSQEGVLAQESYDVIQRINEIDQEEFAKGVPEYTAPTININGVERQTANSNGEPIAKSQRSLEYFYKWFGDSKVVDKKGRPLVVYHGTSAEFDTFRKGNIFTTDNQEVASEYGSLGAMPLYIKLENPLIVDAYGQSFGEIYNAEGMKKAYKDLTEEDYKKLADTFFDGDIKEAKEWYPQNEQGEVNLARAYGKKPRATNEWANYARKEGYDGVIIKDVNDTVDISNIRATDYVAFNPNQIKSTSNRGTYSESENIYYQFIGEKAQGIDKSLLAEAQKMHAMGASKEHTRQTTGWFIGGDGKWRFEISDKDMKIVLDPKTLSGEYKLKDIVKHDELYKLYPFLRDIKVIAMDFGKGNEKNGAKTDIINKEIFFNTTGKIDYKNTLAHEIQHIIQLYEGFASGSGLEMYKAYEDEKKLEFDKIIDNIIDRELSEKELDIDIFKTIAIRDAILEEDSKSRAKKIDNLESNLGISRDVVKGIVSSINSSNEVKDFLKKEVSYVDRMDFYLHSGGEIESFVTGESVDMTMEERLKKPMSQREEEVVSKYINLDRSKIRYEQEKRGSIEFRGNKALITLTEQSNSSTLAHELAHYWLQNTFLYSKSGLATPEYKQFFNSIAKYLDITDDQETIKEWQQEKWARAAEMYAMGKAPEGMEKPLTQYQQWIRKAYGEMSEPMYIDENGEAKVPEFDFETMKMFANLAGETLTEPEFKQKQEAVRGLAKSTNQMAQAKGMKTELPTYEKRSATDMGKKADEFIQRDKQLAIDIVKGLKPEQEGLFRQDLFAALRELALNEGDSDLLNELSKSMTVEEATELGQRIQALARGRVDPVKQMVELRDERMKKNKVDKKKLKEETEKAKKEIKKEMAEASTPKEWADFIKSLEC